MSRTVYDCCMFLNENDLYEIRLNQHWDFVDKFIVLEAGQTHTGIPKPYRFDQERFKPYSSKLTYIQMDSIDEAMEKYPELVDHPVVNNLLGPMHTKQDWLRDHFQFDYIAKILLEDFQANSDDIVYISCLDEILRQESFEECVKIIDQKTLTHIHNLDLMPILFFGMYLYAYKINLLHLDTATVGMVTQVGNFTKMLPSRIRHLGIPTHPVLMNAGWHFTFLDNTDGEMVLEKQRSWAHSKDVYPGKKTKFDHTTKEEAVARFFEDYKPRLVNIGPGTHPQYLLDNLEKFQNLIYKEETK